MDRLREGLVRADTGIKVRSGDNDEATMVGRFAVADEWTEIKSFAEGHFFERSVPGAFDKTIKESRDRMRVLFHHGQDPYFGNSVLGPIRSLELDTSYEVGLLDTDYNVRLRAMLEHGLLGSSFRFSVIKEDVDERPRKTDWNPDGIPQVTLTEVKVSEFGPTPLPAYAGASAGLRSLTDELQLELVKADPQFKRIFQAVRAAALLEPKPEPDGEDSTSLVDEPQHSADDTTSEGREDKPSWLLE